jgi:formate dehydrogenase alpha subunit
MTELTINGKKISTPDGSTILETAIKNGIKIPNLCYDGRVTPHGACRLCIVEIEGKRKPEASCATFATEGMVVWTDTPRVRKIRQTVLELMLVHHPIDCPVCGKAGECDVQDMVFEYGKPEGRFVRDKKHDPPNTKNPLIEINASRCVLCGKCVRVCSEHQGRGGLGFIGRGFDTVVQPAFGEDIECDYCGQCIDVCPTGALLNKSLKFSTRPWFLVEKDTICPFCSSGCTLTLGIMDGRIVRSKGKADRGVNKGDLCSRGRFGTDYIYSRNRLTTPLIRKERTHIPVSWDEALSYISSRLKKIITAYGPGSVGAIGSPRCTNEENYIFQKFMRKIVHSDNIDSSAAFGYGIAERGLNMAFGLTGHTIGLQSPKGKEVILIIESDLSTTHPVFGLNILQAKKEGSKLIVIGNRKTKLTRHCTQWAKIRQGSGVAFLNGIMKVMIDRDLIDRNYASGIKGFSALEESLKGYTLEKASGITGIPGEEIVAVAEGLSRAGSRMITFSIGISENTNGLDTVLAAANLANLLGDDPDTIQIPAEYANTFGLFQMGVRPDSGPAYKKPGITGKRVREMLYKPGSLEALYIMGADPVVTFPDNSKITAALKSLNLLVVQDIALTETAKFAHVILPASSWAEKDGTFVNSEGVTQKLCKAIERTGQSLPDWEIIKNLAEIMGNDLGIHDRKDIEREISSLPFPAQVFSGKTRVFNPAHYTPGEKTDKTYPLNMVMRDVLPHAGSISTRSETLSLVSSEAFLEINGKDAIRFGISDNRHVRVTSRQGTVYLKALVSDEVPDGIVYVPVHFPHSGVSSLTSVSENGRIPLHAVRIETV